jgi:PX domain
MITNSKMVKGGLFSSSYVSYKIVVKPLEYVVERRYNDFLWLRDILSREYPGIFVDYGLIRYHRCRRRPAVEVLTKNF